MPITAKYIFIASMDVEPEKEDLFNEVYDVEHVPCLLKVPGVLSVTRHKAEKFKVSMGGELREVGLDNIPAYSAIYELESAEVIQSDAWAAAVEEGRWPEQVRPYTSNRKHELRKLV